MSTKIRKNAGKLLYLHQILGLFMKKTTFITAIVAIMMMAVTPAFAQEENGYKGTEINSRDLRGKVVYQDDEVVFRQLDEHTWIGNGHRVYNE